MFLLGTLISVNAQVPSYVPSNGLVGWYPFNGNANDESGNGNHGRLSGPILVNDRFSNLNSAYSFDGINDFISITATNNNQDFTFSIWAYVVVLKDNFIISNFPFNPNYQGREFRIESDRTTTGVVGISNNWLHIKSAPAVNQNVWSHLVFTVKSDSAKIYLNNSLIKVLRVPSITTGSSKYRIGTRDSTANGGQFNGVLDDIGIWNRALTALEIKDLYNGCQFAISTEPTNQSSNINAQAQFNVVLNDTTANYQWQSNQSNLGWVNVPSSSYYSGVTSKKLIVNNIQINNHKQLFRVIASKNTCKDTSVVAMLTVNDTCITSTTDTLYIKVNTSSLSNPVYNTVKVYPNPSSTQVIIDNGNYSTMGTYTAKIVNTAGQQVFQSLINQQQFVIDAKTIGGAGVYTLYITDANNKVVGVKKIVLQ